MLIIKKSINKIAQYFAHAANIKSLTLVHESIRGLSLTVKDHDNACN